MSAAATSTLMDKTAVLKHSVSGSWRYVTLLTGDDQEEEDRFRSVAGPQHTASSS